MNKKVKTQDTKRFEIISAKGQRTNEFVSGKTITEAYELLKFIGCKHGETLKEVKP